MEGGRGLGGRGLGGRLDVLRGDVWMEVRTGRTGSEKEGRGDQNGGQVRRRYLQQRTAVSPSPLTQIPHPPCHVAWASRFVSAELSCPKSQPRPKERVKPSLLPSLSHFHQSSPARTIMGVLLLSIAGRRGVVGFENNIWMCSEHLSPPLPPTPRPPFSRLHFYPFFLLG